MGIKGEFYRKMSTRFHGLPIISFVIKNTNFFQKEVIRLSITSSIHHDTWYWRNLELKSGTGMEISYDTTNWEICQGDIVFLLGENDEILDQWQLQLPEYGPGECPECHGSEKCATCNGEGYVYPRGRVEEFKPCPKCGATGVCQTCYVPRRVPKSAGGPTGLRPFKI